MIKTIQLLKTLFELKVWFIEYLLFSLITILSKFIIRNTI